MNTYLQLIEYFGCILVIWRTKDLLLEVIRRMSQKAKDKVMPVELPPPGSLWLQNSIGMSWGTTGHYNNETHPFTKWPPTYEIWFKPGSRWVVIDSGKADLDDWYWIDLIPEGQDRKVRIFANRYAMQHWRSDDDREMKRIDG